jgi:hypothetical protein
MTYRITIENIGSDDVRAIDTESIELLAREILAKFPTFTLTTQSVNVKRERDGCPTVQWRVVFAVHVGADHGA